MGSPYFKLYRSELKLNILSSLLDGEKKLGDLREELGSSGSTIIHALKDLEAMNLTQQEDKDYKLTSLGVIEATHIGETASAAEALERFQGFWLQHDVTAISTHFSRPHDLCLGIVSTLDQHIRTQPLYQGFRFLCVKNHHIVDHFQRGEYSGSVLLGDKGPGRPLVELYRGI